MKYLSIFRSLPSWLLIAFPLLVLGIIIYIAYNLLQNLGVIDTSNASANKDKLNDALKGVIDVPTGDKLSMPRASWVTLANNLYLALKDSTINDKPLDAWRVLYAVKSASDWNALQESFGLRQNYFFGLKDGVEMPLTSFINKNLEADAIQRYRAHMLAKGIKINL